MSSEAELEMRDVEKTITDYCSNHDSDESRAPLVSLSKFDCSSTRYYAFTLTSLWLAICHRFVDGWLPAANHSSHWAEVDFRLHHPACGEHFEQYPVTASRDFRDQLSRSQRSVECHANRHSVVGFGTVGG